MKHGKLLVLSDKVVYNNKGGKSLLIQAILILKNKKL